MSEERDIGSFRDATGVTEDTEYFSQSVMDGCMPELLENKFRVPRGKGKSAWKKLWKILKDPYEIACLVGYSLSNKKCSVRYLESALTRMSEDGVVKDQVLTEEVYNKSVEHFGFNTKNSADSLGVMIQDEKDKISVSSERPSADPDSEDIEKEDTMKESSPHQINTNLLSPIEFLTYKFCSKFGINNKANPYCRECYGTGIGVLWFGSPEMGILAGKYGVCNSCLPGFGPVKGYGLVTDGFFESVLDEGDQRFRDAEDIQFGGIRSRSGKTRGKRGFVYFIMAGDGNIKIGWSLDPYKRIKGMQTSHSSKLELLLAIEAYENREDEIHEKFSHLRIMGEWFSPGQDLIDFIEDGKRGTRG